MTIRRPTYQAAEKVSSAIEEYFLNYSSTSDPESTEEEYNLCPDVRVIETILDTAFWTSLRREEGHSPKISIAFLPPEKSENSILFQRRQRFSSEILTKLSTGIERPGIHLGVWHENETLLIWGTTGELPDNCMVVDVSEPGILVIKHRRLYGFGKFSNVAVLIGDQIKIVDKDKAFQPDCPEIVLSLIGLVSNYDFSLNIMIQLAVSMRKHAKGGILLLVPSESSQWRKSITHPVKYAVDPPYSRLRNLMQMELNDRGDMVWEASVTKEIERIAGLTAVDGATIMNDSFDLLAFGAKIRLVDSTQQVEEVMVTEPVIGKDRLSVNPSEAGGTRHFSAAQFIHDQKDAIAFVASQDGRFTIFSWSTLEEKVQAYRIETLLL